MRAICLLLLTFAILVLPTCDDNPSASSGPGGNGEVPAGVWMNKQSFTAPPLAEYDSYLIRYFVIGYDGSCLMLWTSDKDFHWIHKGTFDGVSSVVASDGSTRSLTFNRADTTISYAGQTFSQSHATDEVSNWIDTLNVVPLVSLSNPLTRPSYPLYGFDYDGSSFYAAAFREILTFSSSGTMLSQSPIPASDSLSSGFMPFATDIALSGAHLWLTTVWNERYQRLFLLDPATLQVVDSRSVDLSAGQITSIAVADNGSTFWTQVQRWPGGNTSWIYRIDAHSGQKIDSVHFLSIYSSLLGWHNGSLWCYRILSSAYDLSEVLYLQEVNPTTGRTIRSIKLLGFPNRSAPPYFPNLRDMVILGSQAYFLDADRDSVWNGVLPTR